MTNRGLHPHFNNGSVMVHALHNIRKIIPFLSYPQNHTLPLVILRLDYCNAQ